MSRRIKLSIWTLLVVALILTPVILLVWPDSIGNIFESVRLNYIVIFAFPFALCGACTIALMRERIDDRPESVEKSKSIAVWWVSSFTLLAPINYFSLPVLGYLWFITNFIQWAIYTVAVVYFGLRIFRSKES